MTEDERVRRASDDLYDVQRRERRREVLRQMTREAQESGYDESIGFIHTRGPLAGQPIERDK